MLAAAAADRFEMLVRDVAVRLDLPTNHPRHVRKPDAYIRSSLARTWQSWMSSYEDRMAELRHAAQRSQPGRREIAE